MKRDAASTIFRTVVFAGAMLGAPACGGKKAQTTPQNTAPNGGDPAMMQGGGSGSGETTPTADPCGGDPCGGDPCAGMDRPRGTDEDGGGGMGRGFVLS